MNISFIKQKNIVFLQTDQRAIHLLFRIWTPSFTLLLFLINTGSFGAGGLHCGSEERKEPTSISAQSFYQTEGGGKLSVPVLLQQIRTDFFARTTNDKSWLILENLEILERDVIWLKTAGFRLEAQNNCWNFLFAWRKQTTFSLLTQEVFVKKWKRCRNCFLERFSHHASPLLAFDVSLLQFSGRAGKSLGVITPRNVINSNKNSARDTIFMSHKLRLISEHRSQLPLYFKSTVFAGPSQ